MSKILCSRELKNVSNASSILAFHKNYAFIVCIYLYSAFHFMDSSSTSINDLVHIECGTLPIIISVPHGGALCPVEIPDRSGPDVCCETDWFTQELSVEIFGMFC